MLTELQRRKFKRLFEVDDEEKHGFVDRNTYIRLTNRFAEKVGWTTNSPEYITLNKKWMYFWDLMEANGDLNKDQKLSEDEFLLGMDFIVNKMKDGYENVLTQVPYLLFRIHDTNGDGVITFEEYNSFLNMIHSGLDEDTIKQLFMKIDLNGDKVINIDEFEKVVYQFFYSNDINEPGNYLFGKF